jgi:hypothetical protein
MADHEAIGQELFGQETSTFDGIVATFSADSAEDERQRRWLAYRDVGATVDRLLEGRPVGEAVHRHPVEFGLDSGNRTVFVCREIVPGHASLIRVIVNDEVHKPISGDRELHIRDFVMSTLQKAMTLQQSRVSRRGSEHAWPRPVDRGPLLQLVASGLVANSGDDYSVLIPKTRGYPHQPGALIEQRVWLQALDEELSALTAATIEPGYPSTSGIMS